MNILVLGSGGREHTIAHKISLSPLLNKLFVAPGNAGTSAIAKNVAIGVNDFEGIKSLVLQEKIDLVKICNLFIRIFGQEVAIRNHLFRNPWKK